MLAQVEREAMAHERESDRKALREQEAQLAASHLREREQGLTSKEERAAVQSMLEPLLGLVEPLKQVAERKQATTPPPQPIVVHTAAMPQSHVRTIAQALVRNLPIVREFAHGEVEQVNITAAAQTKESQMHLHCDSAGHTHAAKMACLLPDTNARIRQRARHPDAARRLSTGGIGLA